MPDQKNQLEQTQSQKFLIDFFKKQIKTTDLSEESRRLSSFHKRANSGNVLLYSAKHRSQKHPHQPNYLTSSQNRIDNDLLFE